MERRTAVLFLACQAVLVAAWWLVLWWWPASRAPFVVGADWPESTLLAFAVPDLLVIVGGSSAAAIGLHRTRPWAEPVLWLVFGAVAYATLWCLGALAATGAGWLSLAMMLASCAGTAFALRARHR